MDFELLKTTTGLFSHADGRRLVSAHGAGCMQPSTYIDFGGIIECKTYLCQDVAKATTPVRLNKRESDAILRRIDVHPDLWDDLSDWVHDAIRRELERQEERERTKVR